MSRGLWIGVLWVPVFLAAHATGLEGYRLSGTIDSGEQGYFALIEFPDRTTRLLRPGDLFDGGKVVAVLAKAVQVEVHGGRETLWLEGDDTRDRLADQVPELVIVTVSLADDQVRRVGILANVPASTPDRQVGNALLEILTLPSNAIIRSLDGVRHDSALDVAAAIDKGLRLEQVPHLFLDGASGIDEVYVERKSPRRWRDRPD